MADSSILTDTQRKYLRMSEDERNEEYTKQQRSYHRGEIRERVRAAILEDVPVILEKLEPEEIFDPKVGDTITRRELADALRPMVVLAYRLADAAHLDPEEIIDDGVSQGRASRGEYLLECFREDPGRLTLAELKLLRDEELIDETAFTKVYHGFLESIGIEIPDAIQRQVELADEEGEESFDAEEELDKYGTGVEPSPSRPATDEE